MRTLLIILTLFTCLTTQAQDIVIDSPLRYLVLGDSYTIGQSVEVEDRWPNQLAASLEMVGVEVDTVHFIATTGWRTDNLINGIDVVQPANDYNLVSILIGVNNQYQGRPIEDFVPDLKQIIDRGIQHAGGDTCKVFLVSIPDYAHTPFGNGNAQISQELDQYNDLKDSMAAVYGIPYIYITDITREGLNDPDLVANDNLHPSGKAYGLFASRIMDQVQLGLSSIKPSTNEMWQGFEVYPNPGLNTLQFSLPFKGLVHITNMQGQSIKTQIVDGTSMDVGLLPRGQYLISFEQGHYNQQFRWVKY